MGPISTKSRFKITPVMASCLVNILLVLVLFHYTSFRYFDNSAGPQVLIAEATYPASVSELYEKQPIDLENATTIFNSVYGALKQKDANANPVGVTFIPAYLPPNTMMYHSTESPNRPESYEWIAMDYEFSYSFASFRRGKSHEPGPGKPGGPKGPHRVPPSRGLRKTPPSEFTTAEELPGGSLKPPPRGNLPFGDGPHYLYTFKNTKPLDKLIFLDGASAAKTETGEMDQQLILSSQHDVDARVDERVAADKICKWGKSFGLQGYVRLEVGYEIVLCDFFTDIELVSNVTLLNVTDFIGFPEEPDEPSNEIEKARLHLMDVYQALGRFDWVRAGSLVNEGEERILLDFTKMVTPVNRTWLNPDPYQRRMNNISMSLKDDLRAEIKSAVLSGAVPYGTTNWPQILGRIIDKFTPILHDLNTTLALFEHGMDDDLPKGLEYAAGNITRATYNLVRRYTDESTNNGEKKVRNAYSTAVHDYVHPTFHLKSSLDALIYSAAYKVTKEVVQQVFDLFFLAKTILSDVVVDKDEHAFAEHKKGLLNKKSLLNELIRTLRWSSFIRCSNACNWDEVCYVPTWGPGPVGWGIGGNLKYIHYEDGSYRVNPELQCIKLDVRSSA